MGHANGHIFLYDLAKPQTPTRVVKPVDYMQIASARKEGHLSGSKIIQLGFVGVRHTAIVSADDAGLAFYHSLGKVLFVEANDVLRILGNYPEDGPVTTGPLPPSNTHPRSRTSSPQFHHASGRNRKNGVILAMSPLPIAASPHPTDAFNVIALLTPLKLVIVGLKPSPRTWFRRHRGQDDDDNEQSTWRGCIAWFPSVPKDKSNQPTQMAAKAYRRTSKIDIGELKKPILAYSWGKLVMFLRLRTEKIEPAALKADPKEKTSPTHALAFDEAGELSAASDVLAMQWLNDEVIIIIIIFAFHLILYDAFSYSNFSS